ncbi:MAG: DUF4400 domain-containing protein [Proteobacteria bacterium]|nr:DUF4400 domain-containing protein [Pseudomonadota bacterium]
MQRSILLSLMIWLLEVVFVAALVSDDWLKTVQHTEDAMVVSYLGKEKDAEIRHTATAWFDRLFVRTGVKDRVNWYFIPSEQERQHSLGFEDVGQDSLFPFIAERIQVIWDGIFQAMRRFFMMLSWWPFLLSALMPFVSDGLARRKIKQSNFDYSSPLAHRYSFFALLGILYLLLVGLTFPFPVPPQAMPVACVAIALAVNVYLAHTQKRV